MHPLVCERQIDQPAQHEQMLHSTFCPPFEEQVIDANYTLQAVSLVFQLHSTVGRNKACAKHTEYLVLL
eukprot:m.365485 g.365485  ORF g.365485 m.365485 type:complete len:69 (-) comp31559_c0_seq1:10-216(-)